MKNSITKIKLFYFALIIFLFAICLIFFPNFTSLKDKIIYNLDLDVCLDIGLCKEGLPLNTEYGLITINKETCLKYNWEWRDDWKDCHIR